ncbi:MAG: ABC transporter ATP-binding protein [Solirubrobacterales bacterium]|nr:ABC transporter ATP-binding protein [Solirubrobacterales bacterium]
MTDATAIAQPVAPAAAVADAVVRAGELTKRFGKGDTAVDALRGVDLALGAGSFTAIMGPSGSGKSTLLHILAGLDRPTSGWVEIAGTRLDALDDHDLTLLRREQVGFVFQSFNLLPVLTARQNITLPLRIGGHHVDEAWLATLVDAFGLGDRIVHRPSELSGGQQQRVAVARALVTRPAIVFADEPTGNLDSVSSRDVLTLLRRAVDEFGQTIAMVTHDAFAASVADRVVFLADGRIVDVQERPSVDAILDHLKELAR